MGRSVARVPDAPVEADPRWPELDALKGIAILAVVATHVKRSWLEGQPSAFELALDPFLRFAVPAFLFASGALVAPRARRPGFWSVRLRRLLPPYLLASMAAWILAAAGGAAPGPRRMVTDLLLGSAFGPYYYVFVLVLLLIAASLLVLFGRLALGVVLAALLVAQWWCESHALQHLSFFWHLRNPLLWAAYFVAGWCYGLGRELLRRWAARNRSIVLAGALPWLLLLGVAIARPGGPDAVASWVWLQIWSQLGLLMTFGLLLHAVPDPARRLAAASYTIYLWHPFAVYPLRDAMRPAAGELAWDALILPWLAGLVLPLALLALARRTLGERPTSTWLGERRSGR